MKSNVEELIYTDIEKVYDAINIDNEQYRKILMPNVLSHVKLSDTV